VQAIPKSMLREAEGYEGMEYFCLTQRADGFIKGYEDATGKRPETVECVIIYSDINNVEVNFPIVEVIALKK
jgi:hypothetical protein